VGGIGLAALVVGAILGGLTVHDYNVQSDVAQCNPMLKLCTPAGGSAESQGRALGAATTAMLVVGGVGVATAGIWLGVRAKADKAPPTSAAFRVTMGPVAGGGGFRLIGRW
jgi:hypothetical protein